MILACFEIRKKNSTTRSLIKHEILKKKFIQKRKKRIIYLMKIKQIIDKIQREYKEAIIKN